MISSPAVTSREKITDTIKDVATKLSTRILSLAPIACESRMEIPFVDPIATEVKIRTIEVELVSAAYAVSPNKLPIQRLSTR